MERPVDGSVEAITEMIDLATDLMWRYLIDRDELSASAALVVNRLHQEGPLRVTALAEAERASQSGMTQLVQRLERQGWLRKRRDPDDGRVSLVTLGEAGRRKWEARGAVRRQRVADLAHGVSKDDEMALWLAATVVIRVLGSMRETAAAGR